MDVGLECCWLPRRRPSEEGALLLAGVELIVQDNERGNCDGQQKQGCACVGPHVCGLQHVDVEYPEKGNLVNKTYGENMGHEAYVAFTLYSSHD